MTSHAPRAARRGGRAEPGGCGGANSCLVFWFFLSGFPWFFWFFGFLYMIFLVFLLHVSSFLGFFFRFFFGSFFKENDGRRSVGI